jgi:hypothetical protein
MLESHPRIEQFLTAVTVHALKKDFLENLVNLMHSHFI